MDGHVSFTSNDDCYNPYDSYSMICVHCNCCGRFDKATMYECRLATDKRQLEEERQKTDDPNFQMEIQQKNIKLNIQWYLDRIAVSEAKIKEG